MADRQQLIQSAVSFLRDPSAASSPLAQRIAFLESKGLTAPEIEHSLALASSASPGGAQGYGRPLSTREFERDWRDWFIMGVVGGAVGWLAFKLVNKFVAPHLQPPSDTEFVSAQKALEAKYDEAAEMLRELNAGTAALTELVESQRKDVEKDLVDLREAIAGLKDGERKREEWTQKITTQVEDITKSLPSLLDRTANSQAQALQELQGELKSLKSLVITRRPASSPGAGSGSLPSSASTPSLSFAATGSGSTATGTTSRPGGLPSWQLSGTGAGLASSPSGLPGAAYNANPAPSLPTPVTSTSSSSTPATTATTATGATEKEKEKEKEQDDSTVLVDKET